MTNLEEKFWEMLCCSTENMNQLEAVSHDYYVSGLEWLQEEQMRGPIDFPTLMWGIINAGLHKTWERAQDWVDLITSEGLMGVSRTQRQIAERLSKLKPSTLSYGDFEFYWDSNNYEIHLFCTRNVETYKEFLEDEIAVFEKNTGVKIEFKEEK